MTIAVYRIADAVLDATHAGDIQGALGTIRKHVYLLAAGALVIYEVTLITLHKS